MRGDAPQLLDRGDVAMGRVPRQTVRMDTPEPSLQWIDTAFRLFRAYRDAALSVDRVPTDEGSGELCAGLPRDLDRDVLQAGGSSAARKQGVGNG